MTIAELKRNANSGKMKLELVERYGKTGDEIVERLRGIRPVLKANSVSLIMRNTNGQESALDIPCANLVDYDGQTLVIYAPGERELTDEESEFLCKFETDYSNYCMQNPYSDPYWYKKSYFEKSPFPYLSGFDSLKSKSKRFIPYQRKVIDSAVRGDAILKYNVYFD